MAMEKVIESYKVQSDKEEVEVNILEKRHQFVSEYNVNIPEIGVGTQAMLLELKNSLISVKGAMSEKISDPDQIDEMKKHFAGEAEKLIKARMPKAEPKTVNGLTAVLMHDMLGLGKIEIMLSDPNLEEIVVNAAHQPVWVYHKKHGWLRSNIYIEPEEQIENYANIIARRIGKQITTLNPLLDAHLVTGDRANATLYPISSNGNTITIRMFRREPWTVPDLIENNTVNAELMATIWEAIQYELNIIFSGGTASGKTTILGICLPFIPPNHRMISIEDTRELKAPEFLHWVPLTTREPNPEGKGGISMLDLLVNSLRMRPDRIIVGEIRRQQEAEVLFEAMHTGHSVYTTVHANTAQETIRRLVNPPISVPLTMLDAVHLNVVMFRNRKIGSRRVLHVAEFIPEKRGAAEDVVKTNLIFRWSPAKDQIRRQNESIRLFDELGLHTGMNAAEIKREILEKQKVLEWMVDKKVRDVNSVGRVVAEYYNDPDMVVDVVRKNQDFKKITE
ncbi:MAG: ATPase, T2SS/T4P/T4SS family [Candidatus Diapherotrites archaeon]|nr:ATPase, T2SS/T4P/T4SS family [Candidatus Diapherotrites archaeon]